MHEGYAVREFPSSKMVEHIRKIVENKFPDPQARKKFLRVFEAALHGAEGEDGVTWWRKMVELCKQMVYKKIGTLMQLAYMLTAFGAPGQLWRVDEFLGRAVDMAVSGLGEEVSDIGVFVGLIRSLKENGGLVAQPADLVALALHPAVGPLPAAAFAAMENPDDPASWTALFALSSSAFSDLADEDGFMGEYAALRLASGVAGITAERRGEPFTAVARLLRDVAPRVGINSAGAWARDSIRSSLSFFSSSPWPWPPALADKGVYLDVSRALHDLEARASFFIGDANQRLRFFRARSESLVASLPAFSAVVGSAKKALAYDLAMQLVMRIDPVATSLLSRSGATLIASPPAASWCSR